MADEPIDHFIRYHREYLVPDVQRIVEEQIASVDGRIASMRNEMLTGFDKLHQEIAIAGLEGRLAAIESKL